MGVLWTTDKLYSEKKKETKYNIFGWVYCGPPWLNPTSLGKLIQYHFFFAFSSWLTCYKIWSCRKMTTGNLQYFLWKWHDRDMRSGLAWLVGHFLHGWEMMQFKNLGQWKVWQGNKTNGGWSEDLNTPIALQKHFQLLFGKPQPLSILWVMKWLCCISSSLKGEKSWDQIADIKRGRVAFDEWWLGMAACFRIIATPPDA